MNGHIWQNPRAHGLIEVSSMIEDRGLTYLLENISIYYVLEFQIEQSTYEENNVQYIIFEVL